MARVFVAMSGGVDSSVAAALMVEAGHQVTGITMELLPRGASGQREELDSDLGVDAVESARRVAQVLGIPHMTWDLRGAFNREVISVFAKEYAAGRTPNPCIRCNDRIKFGVLLAESLEAGAELLVTGHYARIVRDASGAARLARGVDTAKDQSYFLYRLTSEQMEHVAFPLGELEKSDVKQIATRLGLPSAERAESQEVCFCAPGQHEALVVARIPGAGVAGRIVDEAGNVLGEHRGLAHYTVGQRKGLGISSTDPFYVTALDVAQNEVVVGPESSLAATHVEAAKAVWLPEYMEADVAIQTRYRMTPQRAHARRDGDVLEIDTETAIAGVAPGQAVVCYEGDVVAGGGVVESAR